MRNLIPFRIQSEIIEIKGQNPQIFWNFGENGRKFSGMTRDVKGCDWIQNGIKKKLNLPLNGFFTFLGIFIFSTKKRLLIMNITVLLNKC